MSVGKMPKRKCTGANCPMQVGYVVPETCPEPEKCRYATFPQTNGDHIRNMTDEELAEKISRMAYCVYCPVKCGIIFTEEECKTKWLSWLRSPVEESET